MTTIPGEIYLTAMKKHWQVSFVKTPGKLIIIEHPHRQLIIYGKKHSKRQALHLINRWVRLKAHVFLNDLLYDLNKKVKVRFKKVIIRSHECQWGSYSSTKTISLNNMLIFLPTTLTKHVIYHELCHVRYLSHCDKFWDELNKYDRNWKKNKEALVEADDYIPDWVEY